MTLPPECGAVRPRAWRRLRPTGCALVAAAALLAAGCTDSSEPSVAHEANETDVADAADERLNLVLIVVDTLRADHLGLYGYPQPTSPRLDALARGGVVFTNVTSQAPWTSPSMASLFSSLYPSAHGVLHRSASNRIPRLADAHRTLAEVLADAGWATSAVAVNPLVSPANGLAQGFDRYRLLPGGWRRTAGEVNRVAIQQLDSDPRRPFFLYLHYMDVHGPYRAPEPYQSRFRPTGETEPMPEAAAAALPDYLKIESGDSLAHYRAAYDAGIRYWDESFAALLQQLERRGLLQKTLLVVTSDHGEEFFEHGGFNHGRTLYQEQVHVPLVFWSSALGLGPKRVDQPISLIDVAPTVLGLLGLSAPEAFQGLDRRALLATGAAADTPVFSEAAVAIGGFPLATGSLRAVRDGSWKAVENLETGELRIYDLAAEPDERGRDASPAEAERARALFRAWAQANREIADAVGAFEAVLDAEMRESLEELGYIEGRPQKR